MRSRGDILASWVPGSRPTARTSLPFEALMGLGVLMVALPPYRASWGHVVAIVAMSTGLYAAHRAALRRTRRTWLDLVAPLGVFPLVVLLRDATGGFASGLSPLVIVPVIWLAVFGTRRDLAAAIPLVALIFAAPILLIGGDAYPPDEWRRAFVLTGVAAILAPAVQGVVRRFAQETRRSRETAARLEGVIRGATLSALVTTDLDGRVTSFGVGAESLLGYSAEEATGRDLAQAFFDRAELVTVARELEVEPGFAVFTRLAHQHAGSRVWSMVRADGERVFVLMSATELRDDEGTLVGHLLVAIDATSSIVSQRALTQAEERWRALMDHLPETAVIMVEERTGITVVTGAGVLVHKLRDGAGRRLTQILDQAGPGTLARMLDLAFAGQESGAVHAPVEGAEHEFTASPLPAVGDRRQALLMARDVSRDRQRERVLTAAKERAERMFEDAPQGIALLDLAGVVRQANPALQLLLGGAELVGQPLTSWS